MKQITFALLTALSLTACNKSVPEIKEDKTQVFYIRIRAVDDDGKQTVSPTIMVKL